MCGEIFFFYLVPSDDFGLESISGGCSGGFDFTIISGESDDSDFWHGNFLGKKTVGFYCFYGFFQKLFGQKFLV